MKNMYTKENRIYLSEGWEAQIEKRSIESIHWVADNLSDIQKIYLQYCLGAGIPENRNYGLLRRFLYENILCHSDICEKALRENIYHLKISPKSIKTIYDVGAGHDGWAQILQKVFPDARIVLIDKNSIVDKNVIVGAGFKVVNRNIFDCLDNEILDYGSDVLYFMSEFLHCKVDNKRLLDYKQLKESQICINELTFNFYNEPINNRLKKTGGGFIDPSVLRSGESENFKNRKGWLINYQSSFEYYLWLLILKSEQKNSG